MRDISGTAPGVSRVLIKGEVDTLRTSLEEMMAKVEGVLEQMDKRLADFREDSNTRLNHIESRLNWTLGTVITVWISIIGLLVMVLMRMG